MKRSKEYHDRIKKLFPVAKHEDYVGVVWPDHIQSVIDQLHKQFTEPHGLQLPPYVYKVCFDNRDLTPYDFMDKCMAEIKASAHIYMLSNISFAKEPMSEDVKAHLRDLNERKKRAAGGLEDEGQSHEIADETHDEESHAHVTADEAADTLHTLQEHVTGHDVSEGSGSVELDGGKSGSKAATVLVSSDGSKKQQKNNKAPSRVPIYEDKTRQEEMIKKYPWAVAGSFRQDPDKPASTVLDILCTKCKVTKRTIHAPDLFQVKMCKPCKSK